MFKRSLLAEVSLSHGEGKTIGKRQPPTKFVAETYWFLKPVSFNVGCRLRLHANISEPTVVSTQTGFVSCVASD